MLKFKNGKFTILQVSDAQDLQYTRSTMLVMLEKAYERVNPDLIVLTGDNVLGNHFRDARLLTKYVVKDKKTEYEAMKTAIDKLVAPIEKRKIPFAMIYGNHDDRNEITKDEQADIYRAYKMNIGLDNPDKSVDCDTYNIPIYSSDGEKPKFNIWMLDSAWYDKENDKCFEEVKKETVDWYSKKSSELKKENGKKPLPSLLFLHIPVIETLQLTERCNKSDLGAVTKGNGYHRLKPEIKGVMGEYPEVLHEENGLFEAIKKCGDVKAVVSGHDHVNCFSGTVDGVNIIQTSAASFRCYGDRSRGVRVFTIDENTGEFETEFLTYNELCGNGVVSQLRYIWDADGMYKAKAALIAGTSAVTLGALGAFIKRK